VHAGAWVVAVDGSGSGCVAMCVWAGTGLSTPVVVMVVAACGHASRCSVINISGHGGSMHVGAGIVMVMVVVASQHACALIVVIVVCPCSGTGCPGTLSLSLSSPLSLQPRSLSLSSVPAAALAAQGRHHCCASLWLL